MYDNYPSGFCLQPLLFCYHGVLWQIIILCWQAHTVLEMNYTEQQLTAAVVSEGLRPVLAGNEPGAPQRIVSLIERC